MWRKNTSHKSADEQRELEDAARGLQETNLAGRTPPPLPSGVEIPPPPMPEAEAQWPHEPHFTGILDPLYASGQRSWKNAMEAIRGAGLGPEAPEGVEDYDSAMAHLAPILGTTGKRPHVSRAVAGDWGYERPEDEQIGAVVNVPRPPEVPPMPSGPKVKTSSDNPLDMAWSHLTILKRRE